ncbi:hypothetical protein [Priestia megaterium]|uniref:hypothetical protein n=1 Tax=Priestia megaterium TaxID=1404 RepID=UPI002E1A1B73|nr:hypothetical protein [Priestia megaterium]
MRATMETEVEVKEIKFKTGEIEYTLKFDDVVLHSVTKPTDEILYWIKVAIFAERERLWDVSYKVVEDSIMRKLLKH